MAGSGLIGRGGGDSRPRRALTALALSLLTAGCYAYTEVSPAAVPPGSSVRLRVDSRVQLSVGETPLPDGGRLIRREAAAGELLGHAALLGGAEQR